MQIEQLAHKVESLGFTHKQARILVAGMLLGPAPASKIAEQAGVSRPSAYDILTELESLGLAQRSKALSATLYTLADYAGLERWLERQRVDLASRNEQLRLMEQELRDVARQAHQHSPRVRFVQGTAGIEALQDEALRKAKTGTMIYSLTNHDQTLAQYPGHLEENAKRRLRKRLSSRQFYFNSQKAVPTDSALLKQTVRLSRAPQGDITLYEDRALMLSYGEQWTGLLVENDAIVDALRQLFELAWNSQNTVE